MSSQGANDGEVPGSQKVSEIDKASLQNILDGEDLSSSSDAQSPSHQKNDSSPGANNW